MAIPITVSMEAIIIPCSLNRVLIFSPNEVLLSKTLAIVSLRLQLHGAIYHPNSFVFMLRYCTNLKVIRYESTSFNRIVADKSHRVIAP